MTEQEAMAWAEYAYAHEVNVVNHADVDIAGDLIAGILLRQIIYWFSPNDKGESKIKIHKKDGDWLAKTRDAWREEIRISPRQYDRAVKILKDEGLVETAIHRFNGNPTIHIRPVMDVYNKRLEEWKETKKRIYMSENTDVVPFLPKGENRNFPKVKMEIDDKGKTLTDTTNETKNTKTTCMVVGDEKPTPTTKSHIFEWKSIDQYNDYLEDKMPKFVLQIVDEMNLTPYYGFEFIKIVKHFFEKRLEANSYQDSGRHPWYRMDTLKSCLIKQIEFFQEDYSARNVIPFVDTCFSIKVKADTNLCKFSERKMLEGLRANLFEAYTPDGTPSTDDEFFEYNTYEDNYEDDDLPFA